MSEDKTVGDSKTDQSFTGTAEEDTPNVGSAPTVDSVNTEVGNGQQTDTPTSE